MIYSLSFACYSSLLIAYSYSYANAFYLPGVAPKDYNP